MAVNFIQHEIITVKIIQRKKNEIFSFFKKPTVMTIKSDSKKKYTKFICVLDLTKKGQKAELKNMQRRILLQNTTNQNQKHNINVNKSKQLT